MAVWLVPALKAILPHVATIISVAVPVFTKKSAATGDAAAVQQQITELQAATSQNAAHVRELAEQLQKTVMALEHAASLAEARLRKVVLLCLGAVAVSVIALGLALLPVLAR
jgi:DNA-directed RNA polymerase sigma subunit (sigma70/sigma32)